MDFGEQLGIKYWNPDILEEFLREYILPLWKCSGDVLLLKQKLDDKVRNKTLADLEDDPNMYQCLVGGIDENGNYLENSLASLIKHFFDVEVDDVKAYVACALGGEKPNVVKCISKDVREIPFLNFAEKIHYVTSRVIELGAETGLLEGEPRPETEGLNVEYYLEEPDRILHLIKELIERSINATVGCNAYALFIWTLRKITKKYMQVAYPRIDEDVLEELKIKLGLKEYYKPRLSDDKRAESYTIYAFPDFCTKYMLNRFGRYERGIGSYYYWALIINGFSYYAGAAEKLENLWHSMGGWWRYGHPMDIIREIEKEDWRKVETIGGGICILNETVWSYMHHGTSLFEQASRWFTGLEDWRRTFFEEVKSSLADVKWTPPTIIKTSLINIYRHIFTEEILPEAKIVNHLIKLDGNRYYTLCRFLDHISPGLLLGLLELIVKNDKALVLVRGELP